MSAPLAGLRSDRCEVARASDAAGEGVGSSMVRERETFYSFLWSSALLWWNRNLGCQSAHKTLVASHGPSRPHLGGCLVLS